MSVNLEGKHIVVVGAGPVGCLMSCLLKKRGATEVTLYEKRPDMRRATTLAGRSINLVLTERGLAALTLIRERERVVRELTVPVLGRMMHDTQGQLTYQPYGKDDSEHNHSVSRSELNKFLLDEAEEAGVKLCFEHTLNAVDVHTRKLFFSNRRTGKDLVIEADVIVGADGAPSPVRKALMTLEGAHEEIELLEDGYKEIPFAAREDGSYAMADHALHIWPRGSHMLMGLANLDGSFTGTIYMPNKGSDASFEALDTPDKVLAFFETHYPDAIELVPNLGEVFLENPVGTLGTVRCEPWHHEDDVVLVGDAAHAIVPFFGQGLNCGFEDCVVLYELLAECDTLGEAFARYDVARKRNTDAIADMALENYVEMSEQVGDATFLLKKKIERRIEQELETLYRSRYATVMYSHVPYKDAQDAGIIQQEILAELMEHYRTPEELDIEHARRLIEQKLTPFYRARHIDIEEAL